MYKTERYLLPPASFHISRLPEANDSAMKSRSVVINFNEHFYKEPDPTTVVFIYQDT